MNRYDSITGNENNINKENGSSSVLCPEDTASKIIAAGKGHVVERIIERANEADIPIHKDEELANTLSKLELGLIF